MPIIEQIFEVKVIIRTLTVPDEFVGPQKPKPEEIAELVTKLLQDHTQLDVPKCTAEQIYEQTR